jgi:predicted ATPase
MPDVAELADFLLRSAPSLRILATSRQPLGVDGETVVIVPPLSVPEHDEPIPPSVTSRYGAVTLFVERATAAHPSFELTDANCSAVLKVCRDLDGLPLAIELVAGRLRSLSVEQLLDRLDDRFRLLSMGNRAARSRQRTLRALVDWSFELCSEPEQLLWARLSVFARGFDLDAVEGVCSGKELRREEMLDLVAGLVDKSILVPETDGAERLAQLGEWRSVARSHRDWIPAGRVGVLRLHTRGG